MRSSHRSWHVGAAACSGPSSLSARCHYGHGNATRSAGCQVSYCWTFLKNYIGPAWILFFIIPYFGEFAIAINFFIILFYLAWCFNKLALTDSDLFFRCEKAMYFFIHFDYAMLWKHQTISAKSTQTVTRSCAVDSFESYILYVRHSL